MAAATKATRSILVTLESGQVQRVSGIPANARITFGPVQPGKQGYGGERNALRVYTTQNNQLAVFVGVAHFRDESLTVQMRKVNTASSEESETGPNGSKRKTDSETTFEWEDVK